ncbi:MAG: hypothetical protein K2X99_03675 [Gemmatimonadaceae bacterium]|nr:hypothetical protein [Gemmatimonadaceae bacterium]
MSATRALALARIVAIADVLPESLRTRLVFIGGAVLPLLVDVDSRFDAPRTTKDVDAVTATLNYTQFARMEDALRTAGFRHAPHGPVSRWIAPHGEIFDLSTVGDHAGGTGAVIDRVAFDIAIPILERPSLRQLSSLGYFLMKSAAFFDRGVRTPYESKDLADLAVLLIGASMLRAEGETAAADVRLLVQAQAHALLNSTDLAGALRTHFRDRQPIAPDTPDSLAHEALALLGAL